MPPNVTHCHFDRLSVLTFQTRQEMGTAAGGDAADAINRAIASRGEARVILASAPSQDEMIDALIRADVAWHRVTIFHMDEYVGLPPEHSANFRAYQHSHVLSRVHPRAFHGIAGETRDSASECSRYTGLLKEGPIDVVCLGIGENGHLAFNDPPVADFEDPELVKLVELEGACREQQVNDGCFPELDSVPTRAITLTIPALTRGKELFCVVPGPRKAPAVKAALTGDISPSCPASVLRRHPSARLYIDAEAGSLLSA